MAVGLTLSDHVVDVLYLEGGGYGALKLQPGVLAQPEIQPALEIFEEVKVKEWVDRDALPSWARTRLRPGVQHRTRPELLQMIARADVVIPFS